MLFKNACYMQKISQNAACQNFEFTESEKGVIFPKLHNLLIHTNLHEKKCMALVSIFEQLNAS